MKDESNTSIYQEIMTKRELFQRKRKGSERETKTKNRTEMHGWRDA